MHEPVQLLSMTVSDANTSYIFALRTIEMSAVSTNQLSNNKLTIMVHNEKEVVNHQQNRNHANTKFNRRQNKIMFSIIITFRLVFVMLSVSFLIYIN